jgi:hypothetical protein
MSAWPDLHRAQRANWSIIIRSNNWSNGSLTSETAGDDAATPVALQLQPLHSEQDFLELRSMSTLEVALNLLQI